MNGLLFYCERYSCKMTEQACRKYQLQEYGQACSGCEQMGIPAINFVREEGTSWHYIKVCAYCGTIDRSRFKKGYNRICEDCRRDNTEAFVIRVFNPVVKAKPKKEVKPVYEQPVKKEKPPLKYGSRKGEMIVITCPDCGVKREVKFIKTKQVKQLVRCMSCAKKVKMSLCVKCGKRTRIYPENTKRLELQLCVECLKEVSK